MRVIAGSFLVGILLFHSLAELPSGWWTIGLPTALIIAFQVTALRVPAWIAVGFLWTLLLVAPPLFCNDLRHNSPHARIHGSTRYRLGSRNPGNALPAHPFSIGGG